MVQLVSFFGTDCLQAASPEEIQTLSRDHTWHRLLHFRHSVFGLYRSEVDDPAFFLSARGRVDPHAELEATLEAFRQPASSDPEVQHPQCRFPARYRWLEERLDFQQEGIVSQPCPRFDAWRDQMAPKSVSVIFASAYLNNPASVYGHSFLRLNKSSTTAAQPLLDYTVNYAADVTNTNPVIYMAYGLMGGFRGRFTSTPYYLKVQEYNNLESRDLWEYDLQLSNTAQARLVEHIWEMGQVTLPYYFFNRNCSYQILPLLEVVQPERSFKDRFFWRAIPADTLRVLVEEKQFVTGFRRRASLATRLRARRQSLTLEQARTVGQLMRDPEIPADAATLDAAYDLFKYRHGMKRDRPKGIQEQESRLLARRNALKTPSPLMGEGWDGGVPLPQSSPTRGEEVSVPPHEGHATRRFGLSYGFSNRSRFEELSLRPAIHDQDDPSHGYLPGSQLQMFLTRLRYDPLRGQVYVQEFTLADAVSMTPLDRWIRHPSWKMKTGLAVAEDLSKDPEHALYFGIRFGSGFSLSSDPGRWLFFTMAEGDTGLGFAFDRNYRLGAGVVSGLLVQPMPRWKIRFEGGWMRYPLGHYAEAVRLQLANNLQMTRRLSLRSTLSRQNRNKEVLFSVLLYL